MSSFIFPDLPGRVHVKRTPYWRTTTQEGDTGTEYRIGRYPRPRYRYEVSYNFLRSADAYKEAQAVATFLARHGGSRESFLFRDPDDYAVTDHGFGVGNASATTFQLQRTPGGNVTDVTGTWEQATKPRTNLLLRSQELESASWSNAQSGTGTSVTPAANLAIGPDGTVTAERLTFAGTTTSGQENLWRQMRSGLTTGASYTFSVFLKAGTLASIPMQLQTTQRVCSLTSEWQRFSVTREILSGDLNLGYCGIGPKLLAWSATGTVYAWGAQLELGSAATRYIPTTSAAVTSTPAYWPATSDGFEPVTEPAWSSVTIYKDGAALVPGTDWTPTASGIVTFTVAPASGAVLSWTGNYYKRVRFTDDEIDFARIVDAVCSGEGIELVTVAA